MSEDPVAVFSTYSCCHFYVYVAGVILAEICLVYVCVRKSFILKFGAFCSLFFS